MSRGADYASGASTPEARWARLGPYYAMFPIGFARDAIEDFTRPGDLILDPFCGRGTAPYAAMVVGRDALACEINPVAWIYAATKTAPEHDPERVKHRIRELADLASPDGREPESEFQAHAFCPAVLGFINAARRELRWRHDTIDRTVAAFIIHYLHSKLPQGLSNQMRHCRAMSPGYCVRWWKDNGFETPPEVDPVSFLNARVDWRYQKGIPASAHSSGVIVALGDSATDLPETTKLSRLVVTSPPYSGVTDYKADSWLRLWAIGGRPAPAPMGQQTETPRLGCLQQDAEPGVLGGGAARGRRRGVAGALRRPPSAPSISCTRLWPRLPVPGPCTCVLLRSEDRPRHPSTATVQRSRERWTCSFSRETPQPREVGRLATISDRTHAEVRPSSDRGA